MKLNSAWWILSTIAFGAIVAGNSVGCGPDTTPSTGSTGGDTTSTGSTSSSSNGASTKGLWLAMQCSTDAECGEPGVQGICATSDGDDAVFLGGPSNGYCTMKCQTSGDCPGPDNICLKAGSGATEGRCVRACEIGPELENLNQQLDEFKCHGREDVACYRLTAGDLCLPTCTNDSTCPDGRYCDLAVGTCLDKPATPPPGKKMGQACNPMAMTDECSNGFCIGNGPGKGFCSGGCTLGGDALGQSGSEGLDCGGLDTGLCLFLPVVQNCPPNTVCVGAGDFGFCGGACKQHDDCGAPDLWCHTILPMGFGTSGYCVDEKACPNGQADCGMGTTTTCTETTMGKFCLDMKWPLGTLDPMTMMDGGVDDGGMDDGGMDDGGGGAGGAGGGGGMGGAMMMDGGVTDGGSDAGDGG